MADLNLTQGEADALIAMAKHRIDTAEWDYPDPAVASQSRLSQLIDASNSCSTFAGDESISRRGPIKTVDAK